VVCSSITTSAFLIFGCSGIKEKMLEIPLLGFLFFSFVFPLRRYSIVFCAALLLALSQGHGASLRRQDHFLFAVCDFVRLLPLLSCS